MALFTLLAVLVGADQDYAHTEADVTLGIWGGWTLLGGLAALAVLSLLCGVRGLAWSRSQPKGLAIAGTVVALVAVAAATVLLLAGLRSDEWVRQVHLRRFGPDGKQFPQQMHNP
jgi:hypothetical protein